MKLIYPFVALIVAVSAIPADRHGHHRNNNNPSNVVVAPEAAPTPAAQQADQGNGRGGANRGGSRGGTRSGNQGAGSPTQPPSPPQTTTKATVTASRNGGQATNTASAGQGASNGGQGANNNGPVNANLVPDFGQQPGLQPDGTGNCKADSGKVIPCQCPPSRAAFIQKLNEFVSAGSFFGLLAAPFPTGNSNQDALTRINTIVSTLQNFDGSSGKGCPAAAAPAFLAEQKRLTSGG